MFERRKVTSNADVFALFALADISPRLTLVYTLKCVKPVLNLQLSKHCTFPAPVKLVTSQNVCL